MVEGAEVGLPLKTKKNEQGKGGQPVFFKEQTEFYLISCLAIDKIFSVLSLVQQIKELLYIHIYIYIYIYIYILYYTIL